MLKREDAFKICALLGGAWNTLNAIPGTEEAKKEIGRLADEVRKTAGLPTQNS